MKLLRFGAPGRERPGTLDEDGALRDLSSVVDDFTPRSLAEGAINHVRSIDVRALPMVPGKPRIGSCVAQPGNFLGIGMNYRDHAVEVGAAIPEHPLVFNKAPNCISGPFDDIILPRGSRRTDWEVELAVIIGRTCLDIEPARALDYVAGYTICHDVSERDYQMERGGQFAKGKGCPTFGPVGPWLVTPDEITDVQSLGMFLEVDGQRLQESSTSQMIFTVAEIVSDLSRYMRLEPGDIVTTGTPAGVGLGMKPSRYLKGGEVVRLGIDGLGEQRQRVIPHGQSSAQGRRP